MAAKKTPPRALPGRAVWVEWNDAVAKNNWREIKEIMPTISDGSPVDFVGFLLREDVDGVVMALGMDRIGEMTHSPFFIPRGMIESITDLQVAR